MAYTAETTKAQPTEGDQPIAIIRKNAREELRIGLSTWKGADLINFRIWYDAGNGEKRPGNSAFAMKVELLPDIAEAVNKALGQARADGLIE